jgi:hypothetical protein
MEITQRAYRGQQNAAHFRKCKGLGESRTDLFFGGRIEPDNGALIFFNDWMPSGRSKLFR